MKVAQAIILILTLAACAPKPMSLAEGRPAERLPSSDEVIAHVRLAWATEYRWRVARFASRPNDSPELIDVSNVRCEYYFFTPQCSFDVAARFPDEPTKIWPMFDQFGWDDKGQLMTVIVMYHRRRN